MFDILPCDGFGDTLTDLEYFQPNSPDFNLAQTLRLETGLFWPSPGITCLLGTDFPSTLLFLMDGWSGKLSFLDVCVKVSASFLVFPIWDFTSFGVEVS